MRGRKGTTSQWYCDTRCKPQPKPGRLPCRHCCGYTAIVDRHPAPPPAVTS